MLDGGGEGADCPGDLCAGDALFRWRRLYAEDALSAVGVGEEVVPASGFRALQQQVRELERLLGKKTLENEILREALDLGSGAAKKRLLRAVAGAGRRAVKTIAGVLGAARSNLFAQATAAARPVVAGGRRNSSVRQVQQIGHGEGRSVIGTARKSMSGERGLC